MGTFLKKHIHEELSKENRHDVIQHYKSQSYNGSSLVLAQNPNTDYEVVTFINGNDEDIDDITSFEWDIIGEGKNAQINIKFNSINEKYFNQGFILCFETNSFYKNSSSTHFMRFPKNKIINVFLLSPEIDLNKEGVTFEYLNNISLGAVYTFNIVDLFSSKFCRFIQKNKNFSYENTKKNYLMILNFILTLDLL